jgi:hypothetical protein
VAGLVRELLQQADGWQQQTQQDQQRDMEQLEGCMLQALGGVAGMQQQLAEQRIVIEGQVAGLQHVAHWLTREMGASCCVINMHQLNIL